MNFYKEEKEEFAKRLSIACNQLGINLSIEQKTRLLEYLENLLKWNKTYNLTAIRNPEQGLIQHIFDSLSIIPSLKLYFDKHLITTPEILDVGSGAGLPGAVLAIACQQTKVTCIDTVEKKTSFIKQVASVLKIANLKAIHSRIENLDSIDADLVISRAFASLEDFAKLAGKHVSEKGILVGMKGKTPKEEIDKLVNKGEWIIEKIEPLQVPELQAERCLVWMRRKENE